MLSRKTKKAFVIIVICFAVITLGILIYKYVETNNLNTTLTNELIQIKKELENKDKQLENFKNEENGENNTVYSLPFVEYDDILHLEDKNLKTNADKIDSKLRRMLSLIALTAQKNGKYALDEMDKLELHGLIINNMFNEKDYVNIDAEIDAPFFIEATKYESVFKSVTGIKNTKSFYKDFDYATKKDSKESAYIVYNGKTYYIGKWGVGAEGSIAVLTNISYSGTKTLLTIKTYDIDYTTYELGYLKTITFEIGTNTLRIYNYTVS